MLKFRDYFCGNKISEYGRKNGRVDYATLAKAFDAVLNNNIMNRYAEEWEQENGFIDNSEEIEELEEKVAELEAEIDALYEDDNATSAQVEEKEAERNALLDEIADLESEQENQPEIFQFYIISDNGAEILKQYTNEILFYNSELDMYVWGITHYGTSWSYVLTEIECEKDETAKA